MNKRNIVIGLLVIILVSIIPFHLFKVQAYTINATNQEEFLVELARPEISIEPVSKTGEYEASYEVYRDYNQIVYGTYDDVEGQEKDYIMVLNEETGLKEQKEVYRYLGYAYDEITKVTNTEFPEDATSSNNPTTWHYLPVDSGLWDSPDLDPEMLEYIYTERKLTYNNRLTEADGVTAKWIDENMGAKLPEEKFKYTKLLTPPTWFSDFSVRVEHLTSKGNTFYATFVGDGLAPDTELKLDVPKEINLTIGSNEDTVSTTIDVTASVNLTGFAKASHIEELSLVIQDEDDPKTVIYQTAVSDTKAYTFHRNILDIGSNKKTEQVLVLATLKTVYGDEVKLKENVNINITALEKEPPSVNVDSTVNPTLALFEGEDINVTIDVEGAIRGVNITDLDYFELYVDSHVEAFTGNLEGNHAFNIILSKDDIAKSAKVYKKNFSIGIKAYLKDGTVLEDSHTRATEVTKDSNPVLSLESIVDPLKANYEGNDINVSIDVLGGVNGISLAEIDYFDLYVNSQRKTFTGNLTGSNTFYMIIKKEDIDSAVVTYNESWNIGIKAYLKDGTILEENHIKTTEVKKNFDSSLVLTSIVAPSNVEYYGSDVNVIIDVTGKVNTIPLADIDHFNLHVNGVTKQFNGTLTGNHKFYFTISSADLDIELENSDTYREYWDIGMTVFLKDGSKAEITENKSTLVYINNARPVVNIYAYPSEARIGDEVVLIGIAYSPIDAPITDYFWGTADSVTTIPNGFSAGTVWYDTTGKKAIDLVVFDNLGNGGVGSKEIEIIPAYIYSNINYQGVLKENRVLSIESTPDSPKHYPVDESTRNWTLSTSGNLSIGEVVTDGLIGTRNQFLLIPKDDGVLDIDLYEENTAGYNDTENLTLNIAQDIKPTARISSLQKIYRNKDDYNYASIKLYNNSYSSDYDTLGRTIIYKKYDSDNDGSFLDESRELVYDGNHISSYTEKVSAVGKYQFQLVQYESFTVVAGLNSESNFKSDTSYTEVEVDNLAPNVDVDFTKPREVDLTFQLGDFDGWTQANLQDWINDTLTPYLDANNYKANINVVDELAEKVTLKNSGVIKGHYGNDYFYPSYKASDIYGNNFSSLNPVYDFIFSGNSYVSSNWHSWSIYSLRTGVKIDNILDYMKSVKGSPMVNDSHMNVSHIRTRAVGAYQRSDEFMSILVEDLYHDNRDYFNQHTIYAYSEIKFYHTGHITKDYLFTNIYSWVNDFKYADEPTAILAEEIACTDDKLYFLEKLFSAKSEATQLSYYDFSTKERKKVVNGNEISALEGKSGYWTMAELTISQFNYQYIGVKYRSLKTYDYRYYTINADTSEYTAHGLLDPKYSPGWRGEDYTKLKGEYFLSFSTSTVPNLLKVTNNESGHEFVTDISFEWHERFAYHNFTSSFSVATGYYNWDWWKDGRFMYFDIFNNATKFYNDLADIKRDVPTRYVLLDKSDLIEFQDQDYINELMQKTYKGVNFDLIGSSTSYNTISNIITTTKGQYHSDILTFPENLVTSLNAHYYEEATKETNAILVDELVEIQSMYSDYENDPLYATKLVIEHISDNRFDNPNGTYPLSGHEQVLNDITLTNVGLYEIKYSVRDNPVGNNDLLDNYRKWSNEAMVTKVVHRKPFADFNVNFFKEGFQYEDLSYDLDHQSELGKGIVEWEWMWKKNDEVWQIGLPSGGIENDTTYHFCLRVKDVEGAWSEATYKKLQSPITLTSMPIQLSAMARALDNDFNLTSIPASEYLNLYNIWTSYPYPLRLEAALYNGGSRVSPFQIVNYYTGVKTDNHIDWNNISYKIPDTLTDGSYTLKLKAIDNSDVNKNTEVNFNATISTPVDLVMALVPDEIIADETNLIEIETSKYVDEVEITLYEGTPHELVDYMTIKDSGAKNTWKYEYYIASGLVPEGNYTVKFTASTPNNNSQTKTKGYKLLDIKLENLRIVKVCDFGWQHNFENTDGTSTALQNVGIRTKDFPLLHNDKLKFIKLGYAVDFEIDSTGLNNPGDKITINVHYYAENQNGQFESVDIYIPDEDYNYYKLENSEYVDLSKTLVLSDGDKWAYEDDPTNLSKNTWEFEVFIPPTAKTVKKGETLDLFNDNTFDKRLLIVLDIIAEKSTGTTYDYTLKETNWATDNGYVYGMNKPSGLNLLGKGVNHGEVFFYDLDDTLLDDLKTQQEW